MYLGDFPFRGTLNMDFTSRSTAGLPTTLTSGAVKVRLANSSVFTTEGITLTADFGTTGVNHVNITLTSTAYAPYQDCSIIATQGTVGTTAASIAGEVLAHFSINKFHLRQISGSTQTTANAVGFDSSASTNDNAFTGVAVRPVSGPGSTFNGFRYLSAYSSGVGTPDSTWHASDVPSSDTVFVVYPSAPAVGVNVTQVNGSTAGSTATVIGARLTAAGVDDIWDEVVDGSSMTGRQSQMIQNSAAAGLTSGAGTTAFTIRDIDNTQDRVVAVVSSGNRTGVTLDVSS